MLDRLARVLYLATLALLPWGTLVRFPWLHENAQWSDVAFGLATTAWAGGAPRHRAASRAFAPCTPDSPSTSAGRRSRSSRSPRALASGPAKLLGVAMLLALFVVTSDMMGRPGMPSAVGRTLAATSLLTAAAAVIGVALSSFGTITPLVGTCGDLLPGPLSRAQGGFPHPNLLASWCVFAGGALSREDAGLSRSWRRLSQAALAITVVLTTSRAILAFALSAAIRTATTPSRRRVVAALAAGLVAAIAGLTLVNVTFNPLRPWDPQLREGPSVRLEAATTSFETLLAHPLVGTGPGTSPGRRGVLPFDAHLTPLNVAATLGLPALGGLALAGAALWRSRSRPTDLATWGMLAGLALDGLAQDVEDFRHVWVALGLADAGAKGAGERG